MATGMLGADTDELRALGGVLSATERLLRELASSFRVEVEGVDWLGADADAYRERWGSSVPGLLGGLAERHGERADHLRQQAEGQDAASSGRGPARADGAWRPLWEAMSGGGWTVDAGSSPDVPPGGRTAGADAEKMELHDAPYDTGASIDPRTGDLISTSGRAFPPERVTHHYTTTTGGGDPSLKVGTGPDGLPFKPDHRYVLDDGRTVIETNSNGVPVCNRFIADTTAPTGDSDLFREGGGSPTAARSSAWGALHDGLLSPNRGHGSGAQLRGPIEDLNVIPQSRPANSPLQSNIENALAAAIRRGEGPSVVERHTEFSERPHPSDPNRTISGPPTGHTFEITGRDGRPYLPVDEDGVEIDRFVPETFTR